jgi:hypothetical protein
LNRSRSKYFITVALLALFLRGSVTHADIEPGVTVTVYNNYWYNAAPPLPDVSGRPVVGTLTQAQILNNFDQTPLFNMYEDFIVKYQGFITAPCSCAVEFMAQADDGTLLYLDGQLITNDWRDKGGGGSVSAPVQFDESVSKEITLWFYENGGGAWVQLWWMVNNQWEIVPASAFTQAAVTTTTSTSTTTTSTTTTTTTTLPVTTTTEEPTTTTTSTEPPAPATSPPTTSTTTTYPPSTTIQETTTTWPSTTTTASTLPATVTTTIPAATTTTEVVATATISPVQAAKIATDPAQVAALSADEATEVFDAVVLDTLTEEQVVELVAAVQDAPEEVREAFEEEINVFAGGGLDTYIPVGSTVPVGTRRALIVITTVTAVAAVAARRR